MDSNPKGLRKLARLYRAQTSYYDSDKRLQVAQPDALLQALQSLGAPLHSMADIPVAVRQRQMETRRKALEPVTVAWDGRPVEITLTLPSRLSGAGRCHLTMESGEVQYFDLDLEALAVTGSHSVEGEDFLTKRFSLDALPQGYHRLEVELPGRQLQALLIVAPVRSHIVLDRRWGVFLPLYSLHSARNWGAGDLKDLGDLCRWVGSLGGSVVGTLPLLSSFLDEPLDPSPYAPISRLFWNEFYLNVESLPEMENPSLAQKLTSSGEAIAVKERARSASVVDYKNEMAIKRRILEPLSSRFFQQESPRRAKFEKALADDQALERYAAFRAVHERQHGPWWQWPEPLRSGKVIPGAYDESVKRYHMYAQWLTQEQLAATAQRAEADGAQLYMDLPLGVHPDGYDVWRHQGLFAQNVATGAPPDPFFTRGQNWGFPPIRPEEQRASGYDYFIRCVRHHLAHAGLLRIDHVMGLHRLFWVPQGMEARQGVYVRYFPEETYAILALESQRHEAVIVGEDLGTVPGYVRRAMRRHAVHRTYVLQFEAAPQNPPLRQVPPAAIAGINTHDMPTFAAFWRGLDIDMRVERGLLDEEMAKAEREGRDELRRYLAEFLVKGTGSAADESEILNECLAFLARSAARVAILNIEDLWLETEAQNLPGTATEYPNWSRKARYSLEEFSRLPGVTGALRLMEALRGKGNERDSAGRRLRAEPARRPEGAQ